MIFRNILLYSSTLLSFFKSNAGKWWSSKKKQLKSCFSKMCLLIWIDSLILRLIQVHHLVQNHGKVLKKQMKWFFREIINYTGRYPCKWGWPRTLIWKICRMSNKKFVNSKTLLMYKFRFHFVVDFFQKQ